MKKKYILISCLIALTSSAFSQTVKRIHLDSLTYSNQVFLLNGKAFSGLVYATFKSRKIKSEWEINDGQPHGKLIGYHENRSDSIFKYSYKYTYVNGVKCGKHFEYYLKEENIPNYNEYDSSRPNDLQWIINEFDKSFFGNKDRLGQMNFSYCIYPRNKETGELEPPKCEECARGQLTVYYERLNLPGYNSKRLFEYCAGGGCFWKIHRWKNSWYWD